jgi:hypothetical protein
MKSESKYCNIELRQSNTNTLQYLFIFLQYLKIYWENPCGGSGRAAGSAGAARQWQ